jgi:hypothetical protein
MFIEAFHDRACSEPFGLINSDAIVSVEIEKQADGEHRCVASLTNGKAVFVCHRSLLWLPWNLIPALPGFALIEWGTPDNPAKPILAWWIAPEGGAQPIPVTVDGSRHHHTIIAAPDGSITANGRPCRDKEHALERVQGWLAEEGRREADQDAPEAAE